MYDTTPNCVGYRAEDRILFLFVRSVLGQLLLKKDHILAKERKLYVKDHLRSVQDRIFSLRFSTSQDPLDFKKYFLKIVRSFEFVSLRAFE